MNTEYNDRTIKNKNKTKRIDYKKSIVIENSMVMRYYKMLRAADRR